MPFAYSIHKRHQCCHLVNANTSQLYWLRMHTIQCLLLDLAFSNNTGDISKQCHLAIWTACVELYYYLWLTKFRQ